MKTLVVAGALTLLFAAATAAAPGTAVTTVNLRAEANTASTILGKIGAGSRVEVGDCTNGWCAATWQGKSGFVIQTSLDMSGRAAVRARRLPPGAEHIVAGGPPGYVVAPGPAVVYAPGPYYYGAPYWRGYYGPRWGYGWGWRRW